MSKGSTLVKLLSLFIFLLASFHASGAAQETSEPEAPKQEDSKRQNTLGTRYLKNLFSDQKNIWTSPARIRQDHLPWLIPFVSISGGLFATDSNVAKQLSRSPSLISNSR